MSTSDSAKIKKSVLMRYPNSFLLETSRALVGYKSFRDNKKIYRAVHIMHNLIEFVTTDPITGKRSWEMDEKELAKAEVINIPEALVQQFNEYYIGPRADGKPSLLDISPGPGMDPAKDVVVIRRPLNFLEMWGDRPAEYVALAAGFSYQIESVSAKGIPIRETIPMVKWDDPDLKSYYTNTIPFAVFTEMYDQIWYHGDAGSDPLSEICTRIERIVASALFNVGQEYSEAPVDYEADDDTGEAAF